MLKKGFAAFLAASVFMLQAFLPAFAADGDFTSANNPVTIAKGADGSYTVTVDNAYFADATVTVAALANGSDPSALKTDPNKVLYANEARADGNGRVQFRFYPKTTGAFYVAVGSSKPVSYTADESTTTYIRASAKTYTVTVTGGANGTVTPAGQTTVEENERFTVTAVPDDGFELEQILCDGVPAVASKEGKYTLNVTKDTAISVTFKALTPIAPSVRAIETPFVSEDKNEVITFGQLTDNGSAVKDYGIIYGTSLEAVTDTPEACEKYQAVKSANGKGQFGIRFFGDLSLLGDTYYTRAYVTYQQDSEIVTIYSEKIVTVTKEV